MLGGGPEKGFSIIRRRRMFAHIGRGKGEKGKSNHVGKYSPLRGVGVSKEKGAILALLGKGKKGKCGSYASRN